LNAGDCLKSCLFKFIFFLDEQGHLALLFFKDENGGNGIFYPAKMLN
jgi:hypothetical protein